MDVDQKLSMGELRVDGEMTIYRATEVAQTLFASVRAQAGDVNLDLSDVTEFDTAGLQLVLMARRMVEANGHRLDVVLSDIGDPYRTPRVPNHEQDAS